MYELELNSCASNNPVYVISSSVGSFYVPAVVLLAVYQRIFRLIRERHKQLDKSLSTRSESHCESSEDRGTVLANPIAKRFQASCSNTTETTRQITHMADSVTATIPVDDELTSGEHKKLQQEDERSPPCFILNFSSQTAQLTVNTSLSGIFHDLSSNPDSDSYGNSAMHMLLKALRNQFSQNVKHYHSSGTGISILPLN
ncbi:uncharacterized protein DEA37_0013212 [Paragonimus westermani]|uniref:G-protein coupled receptors family 1 profile domain-containing protein n=1 Tax=Paragonimus westermani TaxID=34504 RepID=A0A5J4NMM0_9TREM|nr:uncharacterized protein DEA37_0013212 [Paragonimus westermani]